MPSATAVVLETSHQVPNDKYKNELEKKKQPIFKPLISQIQLNTNGEKTVRKTFIKNANLF